MANNKVAPAHGKPVELYDKDNVVHRFDPIDAKDVLAAPDCLYLKERPLVVEVPPVEKLEDAPAELFKKDFKKKG